MYYMIGNKKQNNYRGFTVIEMMVAITVFAVVVVIALGSFLAVLSANAKNIGVKSIHQDARYIMDQIAHDVRSGTIDYANHDDKFSTLHVLLRDGSRVKYHFVNLGSEYDARSVYYTDSKGNSFKMNSDKVDVVDMKFVVYPNSSSELAIEQPRVTIIGSFQAKNNSKSRLKIQTSVVSRQYIK